LILGIENSEIIPMFPLWKRPFRSRQCKKFSTIIEVPKNLSKKSLQEMGFDYLPDFVTEEEHDSLVAEVDPILQKKKYENSHWDKVITGYRELEKSR
jgi:hypothetical protein